MFRNLEQFVSRGSPLEYDKDGAPTDLELRVATAGLLVDVAAVDEGFTGPELARVCTCMFAAMGLNEEDAAHVLEVAKYILSSPGKRDEFLKVVGERFSSDQKHFVVEMLWRVILADGKVSAPEAHVAALVRSRLGLSLEQAAQCRVRAQQVKISS